MRRRDEQRRERRRHAHGAPGDELGDAKSPLPEGRERGQRDRDGGERPIELRAGGQPGQRGGECEPTQLGRWYAHTAAVTLAVIQNVSVTSVTAK